MKVITGLYYTKDHEWVKVEDGKAYIGITDHAQHSLGDIVYVELPDVDASFNAGDVFGVIESVKAASDVFIPISGKVISVNEALEDEAQLINQDSYQNWIICVEMTNKDELGVLMGAEDYQQFCSKLE
jgi:glycine cleavage system H protein